VLRKRHLIAAGLAAAAAIIPLAAAPASADPGGPGGPGGGGGPGGPGGGGGYGYGNLVVSPNPVVEDDNGGVSFVLEGYGLSPLMHYELASPGLNAACTGGDTLRDPQADYDGNFNIVESGFNCVPGTYWIVASENSSPYQSIATSFTILPPLPFIPPPPGP
jgi:hypothetical protein